MLKEKIFFLISILTISIFAFPAYGAGLTFNLFGVDKPVVDIVTDLINFLLSIVGGISLFVLVISGIYYIISGANPEAQNKAKKMILYSLGGLALVIISYAVLVVIDMLAVQP